MLFHRMVLRSPEDDDQAGAGQGSPQGGAGEGGEGTVTVPPKTVPGKVPPSSAQFVTPEILQGVIQSHGRTIEEKFSNQTKKLSGQIEQMTKALEDLHSKAASGFSGKDPKAGGEGGKMDPPELIDLRRKNRDLEDSVKKIRDELDKAQQREKDFRFRTAVTEALQRNKCLKPSVVLAAIAPDLQMDETGKISKPGHTDQFGTRDLDLDQYIKEVVSETLVPELFAGKTRAGSPAGGDQGAGDGKFEFSIEQIRNDPEFYAKHRDQIESAIKRGKFRTTPLSGEKK